MLEKLTKEQEAIMLQTRAEWINLFFDNVKSQKGIDKSMFEDGIKWLYNDLLNKPTPKVVYCDSWLSCLLTIAILKDKKHVRASVRASVGASVGDSVRDSVWASVGASVRDSVRDSVWASVGASVRASVRDSVWASVGDSVGASVWASVGASVRASVRDSVWDSVWASVRASVRDSVWASVRDSVWASVGDSVGASVWASVGASVRASVGASVGDSVRDSVWASVGASVRASVRDSVWASVGDSVGASVWASVGASVRASVRDSVWDSVWASVGDSVRDSVRDSVWASVGDSVGASFNEYSAYIDLSNYGWVSFYDFFEKINILDNFKFKQYKKIIKSGVFQAYEYDNFVFAVQPPISINKDDRGMLHSVSEPSVIFRDKSEYYYIHGVNIQYPLFDKLSQYIYSFDDLVAERNEEIKAAALSFIEERHGNEALFRFISSNLKEIDSYTDKKSEGYLVGTTKGMNIGVYTLFKGKIESIDLAFVRCYCPSTDRMFFLAVDPINNNAKDAIASLYRVPRKLSSEIKYIQRQGERFSTVFTDKGKLILNALSKSDVSDLTHIDGDTYFKLMQYEY